MARPRFLLYLTVFLFSAAIARVAFAKTCAQLGFDPFANHCCDVTSTAGNNAPGSFLRHVTNQVGNDGGTQECAIIAFPDDKSAIDSLVKAVRLVAGTRVIGNGKVTIKLDGAAEEDLDWNQGCVVSVQHGENAQAGAGDTTLEALDIQSGSLSALCHFSTGNAGTNITVNKALPDNAAVVNNQGIGVHVKPGGSATLTNVVVRKTPVGVRLSGAPSVVVNSELNANGLGLQLESDGNLVRGTKVVKSTTDGIRVEGTGNLLLGGFFGEQFPNTITNNGGVGVRVTGNGAVKNLISANSVANNTQEGIRLENGGNHLFPRPESLRVVYPANTPNPQRIGVIGWVRNDTGVVQLFQADDITSGEGKTFLDLVGKSHFQPDYIDTGTGPAPGTSDKKLLFAEVFDTAVIAVALPIVATAIADANNDTSEFAEPIIPSQSRVDGDPDTCLKALWFLKSVDKAQFNPVAGNTGHDPWLEDWDGDTLTNGVEDTDRDCKLEAGESDPDDPNDPTACELNLVLCVDSDGETIPDAKDNCPTVPNVAQTDTDTDGLGDACDNCPGTANKDQKDSDKNGTGDLCEPDADGDGIPNGADNCPLTPNPDQKDRDKDGAGDACDPDDDNDGLLDLEEGSSGTGTDPSVPDSDSDGGDGVCDGPGWGYGTGSTSCAHPADNCPTRKNVDQLDTDEDGIGDACDGEPDRPFGEGDSDGDGVVDAGDNCPMLVNTTQVDTDGDGAGDVCDVDDDNDGLADWVESGMQEQVPNPGGLEVHPLDPKDPDSDGDTYCDGPGPGFGGRCIDPNNTVRSSDNCPSIFNSTLEAGTFDLVQPDTDHDGIGDSCEDLTGKGDADRDSVIDTKDNCPTIRNADQRNTDGDVYTYDPVAKLSLGGGDACDADDDSDGLFDWIEGANPRLHPWEPDSDHYTGEGYDDYCDGPGKGYGSGAASGCKPSDNCPVHYNPDQGDNNGDTIGDECDIEGIGDSDHDGVPDTSDNCETVAGPDQADLDHDGVGDVCDGDDDNDGIGDNIDNCPGVQNPDQFDADGDGDADACDTVNFAIAPGDAGVGTSFVVRGGSGGDADLLDSSCALVLQGRNSMLLSEAFVILAAIVAIWRVRSQGGRKARNW